nr:RNA methyltransferase substrate-binding domain-containing protein [bacterium]
MEWDYHKTLTSIQNPLVKQVVKLKDRRHRDELGLMVIEGYREIARAFESGIRINQLFVCRERLQNEQAEGIIQQATQAGSEILEIDTRILEKIAYRENPDGLVAV